MNALGNSTFTQFYRYGIELNKRNQRIGQNIIQNTDNYSEEIELRKESIAREILIMNSLKALSDRGDISSEEYQKILTEYKQRGDLHSKIQALFEIFNSSSLVLENYDTILYHLRRGFI